MSENVPLEVIRAQGNGDLAEKPISAESLDPETIELQEKARALGARLNWLPNTPSSKVFLNRAKALRHSLRPVFALGSSKSKPAASEDYQWLADHLRLFHLESRGLETAPRLRKLPHVRDANGNIIPRAIVIADGYLEAVSFKFTLKTFSTFVDTIQAKDVLNLHELSALIAGLKLILLETIAREAPALLADPSKPNPRVGACVRSLQSVGHTPWRNALEPLVVFDRVLRQDPAGAYGRMDFESRDLYRLRLSKMAETAEFTEFDVARVAVALAEESRQKSYPSERVAIRESHVGYYLINGGRKLLFERIGYRYTLSSRVQTWIRDHADEFFFPGIEVLTFLIFSVTALLLTPPSFQPGLLLLSFLVLLLPCSQSAVQLMNYLVTSLLTPTILPKLDFASAIPNDCITLVAVPTLLLNENQIHTLVEDLEVRFLGNHDPNIHFALLTDLPDTPELAREDSPLIDLCSKLIKDLNEKYGTMSSGTFFHFHRHRVYNPRERVWMGWERKRGKLMDLNRLLRGQYDSFPVKIGDLSVLPKVRYVITLDSDTELPRGTAARMIGAMAHPLNQAIIDPAKNIVTSGYGILQPRVGVSVQSTARSRLAALYAGETGFDIYTRAVSDAYQDLYGEGSFTGKGIYEVATIHQVLDRRFPRNSLLSHDLIEGAYARAGLVSDIEIIEDYPSHYSAYNRRKHRWLRGDWQITSWLFSRVPDESGALVPNPTSLISRWKILDNLRRSLVEPAIFLLLLFGWLLGESPALWTLATICILLLPPISEFFFTLVRAAITNDTRLARKAPEALYGSTASVFLQLTFLAHQTLVALDAVIRAYVRQTITRRGLLEWETAAEAERKTNTRRTPVDVYLNWVPLVAIAIGALVWFVRRDAFWAAAPILALWASSKLVAVWLNQPSVPPATEASRKEKLFLRQATLRTWRYFEEFDTGEHHWLIPDNVQEEPYSVAARLSPTNLGLELNARQVACEFGYLTVPEFAEKTLRTLGTMRKLPRIDGHFLNWYDTVTLEPLKPRFVSSVDNGNLVASLWTLHQGCVDRLRQPLIQPLLVDGLLDCLRILGDARVFPRKQIAICERERKTGSWLQAITQIPATAFAEAEQKQKAKNSHPELNWFVDQARLRVAKVQETLQNYCPWLLPEFAELRDDSVLNLRVLDNLALEQLPQFVETLVRRLRELENSSTANPAYASLLNLLPAAQINIARLVQDLSTIAKMSTKLADEMDFSTLLDPNRNLLSVGLDVEANKLSGACYDLLATESRTAVFVAIAKEDITQESWFLMGRPHTIDDGRPVLLSWTGTMFEYLMPSLWMRSHPNTLLERSQSAAVKSQQAYAHELSVPWGISESAYGEMNETNHYKYHAFGLPMLALHKPEFEALVISPYSTFLALSIDPLACLENLHRMVDLGWLGAYGFFEAADYTTVRRKVFRRKPVQVRCWMAHHQGMTLLALANFLRDNIVQRWFHKDGRVQATELLLHEKPVGHVARTDMPRRRHTLAA